MLTMTIFGQLLLEADLESRILVHVLKESASRDWGNRLAKEETRKGDISGHILSSARPRGGLWNTSFTSESVLLQDKKTRGPCSPPVSHRRRATPGNVKPVVGLVW